MSTRIALTRADWLAVILALALLPALYLRYWGDAGPATAQSGTRRQSDGEGECHGDGRIRRIATA